jgi:DNA-binding MarR family transcriptional regulator
VVHPTEAGRTLAASAFEKHSQDMEAVAKVLDDAERLQLLDLLRRLGKAAGRLREIESYAGT